MKYIIQDLYHLRDSIQFLNEETTGLENLWYTMWPKKKEKDEDYKPLIFEDIKVAKRYLVEVKRRAKIDWADNAHIHKMYGFKKPEWDIYEYHG